MAFCAQPPEKVKIREHEYTNCLNFNQLRYSRCSGYHQATKNRRVTKCRKYHRVIALSPANIVRFGGLGSDSQDGDPISGIFRIFMNYQVKRWVSKKYPIQKTVTILLLYGIRRYFLHRVINRNCGKKVFSIAATALHELGHYAGARIMPRRLPQPLWTLPHRRGTSA